VFHTTGDYEKLPQERLQLTLLRSRSEGADFWLNPRQSLQVFDIKAEVEHILRSFHIDLGPDIHYTFDEASGDFAYVAKQQELITGGIVPDNLADRYGFEQPVWHVTLDVEALCERVLAKRALRPLGEFPDSRRDLSLVASRDTRFEDIEKSLVKSAGRLLESLQVFDVYKGDKLESGRVAYGVRLTFRSPERTLKDSEVDEVIQKILTKLKKQLGVELRA
jgi:phenylalanyl-tRNA synthetase beta chain